MSEAAQTAAPPAQEPPAEKGKKPTEYLVLAQDKERGGWVVLKTIKSRSPQKAVESVVEADEQMAGATFVAVPKRYWLELTPDVETQTKIVWK